ncbi:hypothetical protein ABW20_dc0107643 [Dactylellina cionopaga]|nr:hypothetical protein ABW20_dc0107643 [Dactylellina cionopaga]
MEAMRPARIQSLPTDRIVRLTNCLIPVDNRLVPGTLLVNSTTGIIVSHQDLFYDSELSPSSTIDLGGRLLVPGFIDVQINGAYGFDFSDASKDDDAYAQSLQETNTRFVSTGVTSYCPTITSQKNAVYQKEGLRSLEAVYGKENLDKNIKMITLAPELLPPASLSSLSSVLASKNVILSAGHSTATFSQLVNSNINMVTHLFNAMNQPHQREPGIPGAVLAELSKTRYFGIIADGVHVHPANIRWAWQSNPSGMCLVTDAMSLLGLPDGDYLWGNGESIVKTGGVLTLKGTTKIAGSCVTLVECLNNFMKFTGIGVAEAVKTVTATPARMLGLEGVKGSLGVGADADLCLLDVQRDGSVIVDEVWKFGVKVWEKERTKGRRPGVVELSRL